MAHSLRPIAAFFTGCVALLAVACNRGPADEALAAAQQALAAAPEVERYLPEEHAAVSAILSEARDSYAAGRYTDALRAAQALPDRIAAAASSAAKRKQQSAAAWNALSADLEPRLAALAERLSLLSSAGATASERLASAPAELATLSQAWAETKTAFARGLLPQAVAAAQDLKAEADSLATRLGLEPAPAAAPAATH
jgi:hypothetical protein